MKKTTLKHNLFRLVALALCLVVMFAFVGCDKNADGGYSAGSSSSASTGEAGFGDGGADTYGQSSYLPLVSDFTWKKHTINAHVNRNGGSGDYVDAYNPKFLDWPFFSDKLDAVTYFCNSMYYSYGYLNSDNQPYVGANVGWCPAWYEWLTVARNWSNNEQTKEWLKDKIVNCPMFTSSSSNSFTSFASANAGYIWSYDTPHWVDCYSYESSGYYQHHNYHYDSNFNFIIAVCNYCLWENSLDVLNMVDTDTVSAVAEDEGLNDGSGNKHVAEDKSQGMKLGDKLQLAIKYVLEKLNGQSGLVTIGPNANDGRNLGYIPANDAGVNDYGYSSTYWDNVPFGGTDAYNNMLFYSALKHLAELKRMGWNYTAGSADFDGLVSTCKTKYNNEFWSNSSHRYISVKDYSGTKRDYGITLINMQAVTYGLATQEKAEYIYSWLDGNSYASHDTMYGKYAGARDDNSTAGYKIKYSNGQEGYGLTSNVYYSFKSFGIAPIFNTVNFSGTGGASASTGSGWFHTNHGGTSLSGDAYYGYHNQNGGTILFPEFYDLMGRIKHNISNGADKDTSLTRMIYLAKIYSLNEFNYDYSAANYTPNHSPSRPLGYVGEFPENGIVPTAYLYGYLGVEVVANKMTIDPNMPTVYNYMGVKDLTYGRHPYNLTIYKNGKIILEGKEALDIKLSVRDWASLGTIKVTVYDEFDNFVSASKVTASAGRFEINLSNKSASNAYAVIEAFS